MTAQCIVLMASLQHITQILKKWNDNKYTDVSSKKESKLNKLAKLASKVDTGVQNEARLKAFQDYLDTCAK